MKKQKLPKQSAPVIRHASPATMSGEHGVEASGFLDIVKKIGQGALEGAVGSLLK
ncbi:hypothetical protein [Moorena sp. SIO4G3]|uniref:hypothetical protein n=1 Tax=Moorena sp. SIO4G3 TaxID=2607821 RepID=UPI0025FB1952|nr:hypothetical protein [Moorena sp. SIO4G3]